MLKKLLFLLLISFTISTAFSQKKSDSDEDTDFGTEEEAEEPQSTLTSDSTMLLIVKGLNSMRVVENLDSLEYNDFLAQASAIQAEDMAMVGKASFSNSKGKYGTTGKRMISVGGTNKVRELVIAVSAKKGKRELTPDQLVTAILKKWRGKKERVVVLNSHFVFASPSVRIDENGKKAYVSVVFGGFDSYNKGAGKKIRKQLKARYTKKNKKINPGDIKACKACTKFKDYDALFDGMYIEEGYVYFKYEDLKKFKKLIGRPEDGLAIDIVQSAQYKNPDYNIKNNNLLSKGILSKTVKKAKLYSNRNDEKGKKVTSIDVRLGKIHKKLTGDLESGDYEINLLVIKGGKVCKILSKSYVEQGKQGSNTKIGMLLMPDSAAYFHPPFTPTSDSAFLSFVVPFEKNVSEYKEEDMLPFLNSLKEPDFIIHKLDIMAYSSVEGDSTSNVKLQQQRSQNIINALRSMQKQNVVSSVKTGDTWDLFKNSVVGTEYDTIATMPKAIAIEYINTTRGVSDSLEIYFSKQRFAEINMSVTYDISGSKEEKFSITKFNQAVKNGDIEQAYKIQYYINQKVKDSTYSRDVLNGLEIIDESKFSGILNNQVVFSYHMNGSIPTVVDYGQLKRIEKIDPSNSYVAFNSVYCALEFDDTVGGAASRAAFQAKIDRLYKSTIPAKLVDALNIEWQFKVIEAVDTAAGSEPIIKACNEKVKSFYDLKNATWENSLKLSYVFARFKDFAFAADLLKDFIKTEKPNEEVLFAYASYCAQLQELMNTKLFVMALQKASVANSERYCKLFGQPFLTFQVLDNPLVKEDYNIANCAK